MPITVADLSDPAAEMQITSIPILKATAIIGAMAYFPRPMTIVSATAIVGDTFATTVIAAGAIEVGTIADPDAFAENTAQVALNAASGTDIPMTLSNANIPGNTWVMIKSVASAGAGNFSVALTVKPKATE